MNLSSQGVEIVGADAKQTGQIITSVSSGLASIAGSIWGPKPTSGGAGGSATPTWIMPVAIGGIGLLAVVMIMNKKKA